MKTKTAVEPLTVLVEREAGYDDYQVSPMNVNKDVAHIGISICKRWAQRLFGAGNLPRQGKAVRFKLTAKKLQ